MRGDLLGRERELGSLSEFLDRPGEGPAGFVLEGEPGIGKSTLWAAAVAAARDRGCSVLASRPAEAERGLAYVVLGDLFEDALDDVLPILPNPRRRALEAALLVDQAPEQPVDPRSLGVAVRTALQTLARRGPLMLAIDDAQWLDASSASALRFALRRLTDERVLLLLARRLDPESDALGLEDAIAADAVERLTLGPLSLGALQLLLQTRLDQAFGRPAMLRLLELSGGNPFYAHELGRARDPEGAGGDPIVPVPLPESLERLVGSRLDRLAAATRGALLLVAAHGRPSPALLLAAGVQRDALDDAVAAEVVECSGGVVRFTHPLLASVVYRRAAREDRRAAHERLAAVVDDPVERGRHLALVTDEPDAEIAAALEEAAGVAHARGAILTAAELAEHALRLGPPAEVEDVRRRTLAAARAFLEAGEQRSARRLAGGLLEPAHAGGARAEALVLMSDIERAPSIEHAIELRREALAAAAGLPRLQADIQLLLGDALRFTEGVEAAERHTVAALELAESLEDDDLRAEALGVLASGRFRAGVSGAVQLAEEATRLAASAADPGVRVRVSLQVALPLVWSFQLDRARTLLETIQREWGERDERTSEEALWFLGLVELRAGRFPLAAVHAERAREIGRLYTLDEREEPALVWLVALIAAHRGELERARGLAQQALALAERQPVLRAGSEGVLGLVALWTGDPGAAAARFAVADEARRGTGVDEPAMFWWHADRV
jgi:tetratricopeptide (TPR) repeat protein